MTGPVHGRPVGWIVRPSRRARFRSPVQSYERTWKLELPISGAVAAWIFQRFFVEDRTTTL